MTSCSKTSAEIRRARPLLGTIVEIRATAPTAAGAERAVRMAFAAVERVHALMSFHDASSDVSRLNRAAAVHPVQVHSWTHLVLRRARQLHADTNGLFDIAVAPALVREGWLPHHAAPPPGPGGSAADIALLADRRVCFRRPLLVDLGGIAKGFAVDRAIAALRRHGATVGAVNAGGDLRVFGPIRETVHVRRPEAPGEFQLLAHLRNSALATSAPYYAARWIDGRRCSPIIDPRDGLPSRQSFSISVRARTCLLADALCKAVWLASADEAASILHRYRARAWVLDARQLVAHPISSRHAA